MGSWFKSNILQNKFVPCNKKSEIERYKHRNWKRDSYCGCVRSWSGARCSDNMAGQLSWQQQWTENPRVDGSSPPPATNSRIGDYTIKTLSKRPASGDPWHLSFLSVVLCHCVFILCLLIKYSVLWLPEAYPFLYISKYIETKTTIQQRVFTSRLGRVCFLLCYFSYLIWRGTQVAKGDPLLRGQPGKTGRGFESLPLRQELKIASSDDL